MTRTFFFARISPKRWLDQPHTDWLTSQPLDHFSKLIRSVTLPSLNKHNIFQSIKFLYIFITTSKYRFSFSQKVSILYESCYTVINYSLPQINTNKTICSFPKKMCLRTFRAFLFFPYKNLHFLGGQRSPPFLNGRVR